ncbi:hypothetical protein [Streptomyces puniciscabiei]|uniref:hypothetical protein n=1 Tax=Streptomyces puniciscabiei TaxID=164348 RepID=UPI0037BA680B
MSDTTSGPADERPTGRFRRPPDEDWTPEDMPLGHHTPRDPLPEERLPGEPPPGATTRLPGSIGPGRNGLTADDLTPEDTPPHPPGLAGETADDTVSGENEMPSAAGAPPESRTAGESGMSGETGMGREGGMPGERRMAGEGEMAGESGPESRMGGERGMPGESGMSGESGMGREGRMAGEGGRGGSYESSMPEDGLGVPSSGEVTGREAHTTESREPDAWPTAPGGTGAPGTSAAAAGAPAPGGSGVGEPAPAPSGTGAPLLTHDETARWEQRMRQLAVGFVDEPRGAVEQADHVLEEIAGRFEEAVERRRRTLRRSWEASEDRGPGTDTDTEQLRLALRDYQELAGRLLHI